MARYGKAAGKSVESATGREKRDSEVGQGRQRRNSEEPQAGDRYRIVGSAEEGREGAAKEEVVVSRNQTRSVQTRLLSSRSAQFGRAVTAHQESLTSTQCDVQSKILEIERGAT